MATKSQLNRINLSFFDGINLAVGSNLAKSTDLAMAENARSTKIGVIEKRQGYRRLGEEITSTSNVGLFYFDDDYSFSKGFYRVSTVSATTAIRYLNTSDGWTAMAGNGTGLTAAECSTVQAENCTFIVNGTDKNRYIDSNQYFFTVSSANATVAATYTNNGETFTVLATITGGTTLTVSGTGTPAASGTLTKASGTGDATITFSANCLNVITSDTTTGHLYNSPKANKINYYKDKLYVGDYYIGTTRYKNGIMRSSTPLGVVALIDGDFAAADCGADDWITVTDTKYIYATDTLDVYRGGTKIADLTVKAKTSTSFQINAITFASGTTFESADEVWVDGTYTGTKIFRWADNAASGEDVKQYDTFKLAGGENDTLTLFTNIGNIMIIGNKRNLAFWNDSSLTNLDLNIGCVSNQGYVKAFGTLFFLGYDGIYATTGDAVPKLISAKIQPVFDGTTKANLEIATMGKKGYSIFAAIGDVTLKNSDDSTDRTLTNVVVEYNIRQDNWFIHTGIDAHFFTNYYTSTDIERLEYCGSSGHVYEFLFGTLDNNSNEIHFRIDSQPLTLSQEFENIVYPLQIIIETETGSAIQCFVKFDGEQFYELQGEANRGVTIMYVTAPNLEEQPARCRNIIVSIRESSKTPCKIKRVSLVLSPVYDEELYKKQTN